MRTFPFTYDFLVVRNRYINYMESFPDTARWVVGEDSMERKYMHECVCMYCVCMCEWGMWKCVIECVCVFVFVCLFVCV